MIANLWQRVLSWFAPTVDPFNVRRAEPDDIPQVFEILSACGRTADEVCLSTVRVKFPLFGERACVATEGDRIVGVMFFDLHDESVELVELAVLPSRQRRGVGSSLVGLATEFAKDRRSVLTATVRGSDVRGLDWLARRGFRPMTLASGRPYIEEDGFTESDAIFLEWRG